MKRNLIINILLAGFILVAIIVCGITGYLNDSGRSSPFKATDDDSLATDAPAAIDLVYCYSPVSLCVISFGQDNTGNMLIVIRNTIPGLTEFYAKLNPTQALILSPSNLPPTEIPDPNSTEPSDLNATETPALIPTEAPNLYLYPCQKVQFTSDVYYCLGSIIPDGTMVSMEVYSKDDNRLVARGRIPVSVEATPQPTVPPATASPDETQITPGYPQPSP